MTRIVFYLSALLPLFLIGMLLGYLAKHGYIKDFGTVAAWVLVGYTVLIMYLRMRYLKFSKTEMFKVMVPFRNLKLWGRIWFGK